MAAQAAFRERMAAFALSGPPRSKGKATTSTQASVSFDLPAHSSQIEPIPPQLVTTLEHDLGVQKISTRKRHYQSQDAEPRTAAKRLRRSQDAPENAIPQPSSHTPQNLSTSPGKASVGKIPPEPEQLSPLSGELTPPAFKGTRLKQSTRTGTQSAPYAHLKPLTDRLAKDLDGKLLVRVSLINVNILPTVVFCGFNPGVMSAQTHTHYGNPHNAFWKSLHAACA
jgi:hypothetical protein